jgi:hypothetical protein
VESVLTGNITSHTHNYAGSTTAGGGAKRLETYYQNDASKTYGSQYQLYAQ